MAVSEARMIANKANAQHSTGPKTSEGKEHSRRNGLKHGLTGAGIVLIEADASEVDLRNEELQAELGPKTALGKILVQQMATLSIRMERSGKQENAAIALRVRHAAEDYDQALIDECDRLLDLLGEDPRIHLRTLLKTPAGVDRLVLAWQDLRADLICDPRPTWTAWHRERAENLCGLRIEDASGSRINALSKAVWGDFAGLGDLEGADLEHDTRKEWARSRLLERIDAEIADLEALSETFDFEMIDLDRAQAGDRALFDPSREASLARRYESEATRGFFKALKELRQTELEAADRPIPAADLPIDQDHASLGSSWVRPAPVPRDPQPTPSTPRPMSDAAVRGAVGDMNRSGRDPLRPELG